VARSPRCPVLGLKNRHNLHIFTGRDVGSLAEGLTAEANDFRSTGNYLTHYPNDQRSIAVILITLVSQGMSLGRRVEFHGGIFSVALTSDGGSHCYGLQGKRRTTSADIF
jgi:hypothetical protein